MTRFDEIILAAPDIDADTFKRDIAPKILAGKGGTTLYASSGDYALMASKTFAGYRRAGDTAGGITIVPGVDTIDASAIRTDFVGHSYYADSNSVLGDLRDLILGKPPAKRAHLAPAETAQGKYWVFSEVRAPAPTTRLRLDAGGEQAEARRFGMAAELVPRLPAGNLGGEIDHRGGGRAAGCAGCSVEREDDHSAPLRLCGMSGGGHQARDEKSKR